jgi:GntR family transcriptional regulator
VQHKRHIQAAVEHDLRALIAERFPSGSKLPPERELAELLGSSRPTLREIVGSMARTGELETRWGVGTFVSSRPRPFVLDLGENSVLRETAREQGFDATFTDMETSLVPCPADAADALGVEAGSEVWVSRRVLRLDDRPMMVVTDHVLTTYGQRSVDLTGFGKSGNIDLLPALERTCGFRSTSFEAVLDVETAHSDHARLLGVPTGVPLIRSHRLPRDANGAALTRTVNRYVPGRVELRIATGLTVPSTRPPRSQHPKGPRT